jgi:hypothetical protein
VNQIHAIADETDKVESREIKFFKHQPVAGNSGRGEKRVLLRGR